MTLSFSIFLFSNRSISFLPLYFYFDKNVHMTVLPECIITYIVHPAFFRSIQIAWLYSALGTGDAVFAVSVPSV